MSVDTFNTQGLTGAKEMTGITGLLLTGPTANTDSIGTINTDVGSITPAGTLNILSHDASMKVTATGPDTVYIWGPSAVTNFVVGPNAQYTSFSAAIIAANAASAAGSINVNIILTPGAYTGGVTIGNTAGNNTSISIMSPKLATTSYDSSGCLDVSFSGQTFNLGGTVRWYGIQFNDCLLTQAGTVANTNEYYGCYFSKNSTNGNTLTTSVNSSFLLLKDCDTLIGTGASNNFSFVATQINSPGLPNGQPNLIVDNCNLRCLKGSSSKPIYLLRGTNYAAQFKNSNFYFKDQTGSTGTVVEFVVFTNTTTACNLQVDGCNFKIVGTQRNHCFVLSSPAGVAPGSLSTLTTAFRHCSLNDGLGVAGSGTFLYNNNTPYSMTDTNIISNEARGQLHLIENNFANTPSVSDYSNIVAFHRNCSISSLNTAGNDGCFLFHMTGTSTPMVMVLQNCYIEGTVTVPIQVTGSVISRLLVFGCSINNSWMNNPVMAWANDASGKCILQTNNNGIYTGNLSSGTMIGQATGFSVGGGELIQATGGYYFLYDSSGFSPVNSGTYRCLGPAFTINLAAPTGYAAGQTFTLIQGVVGAQYQVTCATASIIPPFGLGYVTLMQNFAFYPAGTDIGDNWVTFTSTGNEWIATMGGLGGGFF